MSVAQKNGSLVFCTINNGEARNPRSVRVIAELKKRGGHALVAKSSAECRLKMVGDVTLVVPIFDGPANVWRPMPSTDKDVPGWARELSWDQKCPTGSCVAIGKRCLEVEKRIEKAAENLAAIFSREFPKNGNENAYRWGLAPSTGKLRKRERRREREHRFGRKRPFQDHFHQ